MIKFRDFEKVKQLKTEAESMLATIPADKMPPSGYWLRLVEIVHEITEINAQLCAHKLAWMTKKDILELIKEL